MKIQFCTAYNWRLWQLDWLRHIIMQQGLTCSKTNQLTNQPARPILFTYRTLSNLSVLFFARWCNLTKQEGKRYSLTDLIKWDILGSHWNISPSPFVNENFLDRWTFGYCFVDNLFQFDCFASSHSLISCDHCICLSWKEMII